MIFRFHIVDDADDYMGGEEKVNEFASKFIRDFLDRAQANPKSPLLNQAAESLRTIYWQMREISLVVPQLYASTLGTMPMATVSLEAYEQIMDDEIYYDIHLVTDKRTASQLPPDYPIVLS